MAALQKRKKVQPPKMIFVPSKSLLRKMIRAMLKYGKDEKFLLRFALLEDPYAPVTRNKVTFITAL